MNTAIGDEVKRLRKIRKWTQEDLAERLREIGVDFSVSAVVNLEAHRRQGVALHELVALAAVLSVDLITLAFPDRRVHGETLPSGEPLPDRGNVELLPGRTADATSTAMWVMGMYLPPAVMIDAQDPDGARTHYEAAGAGLDLLREHDALAHELADVAELRGDDIETFYLARVEALRRLRRRISAAGWPLPVLPLPLLETDVDGPPNPVNTYDKEDGS